LVFWTSVVLPFVFVLIMSLMEGIVEPVEWRLRLMRVGWDMCVLAFGVTGHMLVSPVFNNFSPQQLGGLLLTCVAVILVSSCLMAYMRRGTPNGLKVIGTLALGGAALGLPSYFVFTH